MVLLVTSPGKTPGVHFSFYFNHLFKNHTDSHNPRMGVLDRFVAFLVRVGKLASVLSALVMIGFNRKVT